MVMRKLSEKDWDKAIELAEAMREKNQDKYNLAYALLYLKERNQILEDLRTKAEYYVRFGMAEKELRDLRVAIDKIREMDVEDADDSSLFARE